MKRLLTLCFLLLPALASAQVTPSWPSGVTPPIVGLAAFNPSAPITPTSVGVPATTCAAPGVYLTTASTTGIAFTATPSVILCVNGTGVLTTTSTAVTSAVPYRSDAGADLALRPGTSGGVVIQTPDGSPRWFFNTSGNLVGTDGQTFGWSDVSLSRGAADRTDWGAGDFLRVPAVAVGSLPTCNAGAQGSRHTVNDSNAAFTAGIGAVVAAGGANVVPVFCDGTNWRIG